MLIWAHIVGKQKDFDYFHCEPSIPPPKRKKYFWANFNFKKKRLMKRFFVFYKKIYKMSTKKANVFK